MPPPSKKAVTDQAQMLNGAAPRPSQESQPCRRELLRSTVTVRVGPEDAPDNFVTHAQLLTHHSPVFRTMMNGNWAEAKTGVINLTDDKPKVYEIFQNWLYERSLCISQSQAGDTRLLLCLWVFGDKYQVPAFQNATIDILRFLKTNSTRLFNYGDIVYVFENTQEGSPLRQLILDLFIWECPLDGMFTRWLAHGHPHAFVAGVAEGYSAQFPRQAKFAKEKPYLTDAERYHVLQQQILASSEDGGLTFQDPHGRQTSQTPA
ncbi:MAG: hypothetical protein Q9220_004203 [cf. Caloplaca sp. 1 TL-2023]